MNPEEIRFDIRISISLPHTAAVPVEEVTKLMNRLENEVTGLGGVATMSMTRATPRSQPSNQGPNGDSSEDNGTVTQIGRYL